MHWRTRAALVVLGVGWVVGLSDLAERTPADNPKYVAVPTQHEADFRKIRQRIEFPTRGTIAYRDEAHPDTEELHGRRDQFFFLFQYSLAPVLLDRKGRHDATLVFTQTKLYLEKARSKP